VPTVAAAVILNLLRNSELPEAILQSTPNPLVSCSKKCKAGIWLVRKTTKQNSSGKIK
jgi:predicted aconitase with swiveling domain